MDFPTLCPQEWDPGPGAFFGQRRVLESRKKKKTPGIGGKQLFEKSVGIRLCLIFLQNLDRSHSTKVQQKLHPYSNIQCSRENRQKKPSIFPSSTAFLGCCSSQLPPQQKTRWWFQICFIFTPIWGWFPIWLIFFKGVQTTNQKRPGGKFPEKKRWTLFQVVIHTSILWYQRTKKPRSPMGRRRLQKTANRPPVGHFLKNDPKDEKIHGEAGMKSNKIMDFFLKMCCYSIENTSFKLKLFAEQSSFCLCFRWCFWDSRRLLKKNESAKSAVLIKLRMSSSGVKKHQFGMAQNFPGTADLRMIWVCWSYSLKQIIHLVLEKNLEPGHFIAWCFYGSSGHVPCRSIED